jgi:hypothetical protein
MPNRTEARQAKAAPQMPPGDALRLFSTPLIDLSQQAKTWAEGCIITRGC